MFFRLYTLGCKVNQYETEFVRTALLQSGSMEAEMGQIADLVFVNTCTVTAESEAKSRKIIRKLVSEHPRAKIVVMGCAAAHHPDIIRQIDGVSHILTDKEQIPAFLRQLGITALPAGIASFGERHRAFVKVQDGCRVGCAYCIIPKVRPILRSRTIEEILPEIQALTQNGYREIVLTGIHLGHYGIDLAEKNSHHLHHPLARLVRHIVELPETFRLRLSSLEAVEVSDELIDLMVHYPDRICPHLHLSMQSGSDEVLRRMKRRWLSEPFVKRCEEIMSRFDRLALTTDVIVGFPGETAEQFEETCRIAEHLRFSKIHIFRYSPRQGTEAAALPNRVPPKEQKHRAAIIACLAEKLRSAFAESLIGSQEVVLLETATHGTCGRYLEVRLTKPAKTRSLAVVQIERNEGDVCFGNVVKDGNE